MRATGDEPHCFKPWSREEDDTPLFKLRDPLNSVIDDLIYVLEITSYPGSLCVESSVASGDEPSIQQCWSRVRDRDHPALAALKEVD
ncbi:hypothetical protein TNCV_4631961 [Trichonephila clavipes]|nr:hypothetical protein TNCV_4631961 [Trichonephila clavipes]